MKKNSLIHVGCSVGDKNICKLIEDKKITLAIFIDANLEALKTCRSFHEDYFKDKNNQTQFEYIHCAISTVDTKKHPYIDFHIPIDNNTSEHGSLRAEIIANNIQSEKYKTIKVQNINTDIIRSYTLTTIDYLILDVEGHDEYITQQLFTGGFLVPLISDTNPTGMEPPIVDIRNFQFEFSHWGGFNKYNTEKSCTEIGYILYVCVSNGYTVFKSSAGDIVITKDPMTSFFIPDAYKHGNAHGWVM